MRSKKAFSDIEVSESYLDEYNHDAIINMDSCDYNSLDNISIAKSPPMQLVKD